MQSYGGAPPSREWAHVSGSGATGHRRLSVTSATSLAGGNSMLAAVQSVRSGPPPSTTYLRLDAARRDREKDLSSALISSISQSPFARSSTTEALSTLSSPAPLAEFMKSPIGSASPSSGVLGVRGTAQPRIGGMTLRFGSRPGTTQPLPGVYYSPGRRDSVGSTYLSYLVEERKRSRGEVTEEEDDDDVDLGELAAQAAKDEATLKSQWLSRPPASAAPMPSSVAAPSWRSASVREPEPEPGPEPEPELAPAPAPAPTPIFAGDSAFGRLGREHHTVTDGPQHKANPSSTAAGDEQPVQPSVSVSTAPRDPSPPTRFQPVKEQQHQEDDCYSHPGQPLVIDTVAKPASPRPGAYKELSPSLPARTPSPSEMSEHEIGGQWRRQFGEHTTVSTVVDGDEEPSATDTTDQAWETRDTQHRLDKLRGGPPRKQSSRSSSRSETSAKPDALVEDPPPMPGFDGPADALLRRIERHFDANGDGQLDDAEISQMFDTLDEAGTGRLTQGDLRAALTKAHIFTQSAGDSESESEAEAEAEAGQSASSPASRHFRSSAQWSGSADAIDKAIPAQFNALREGIRVDEVEPLRPSLVRLSKTGDKMLRAVEEQSLVAKQVQLRKGRDLSLVHQRSVSSSSSSSVSAASPATRGVSSMSPVSRSPGRGEGLSLTLSTVGAVRTSSGVTPRTVADEVRAGQRGAQTSRAQQREARRAAEDKEEAERKAFMTSKRATYDSLFNNS